MRTLMTFRIFLLAAVVAAIDATPASATLVIADYNDLSLGEQRYQYGGTGFSSTDDWDGTGWIDVISGDLTAPAGTGYALTQSGPGQSILGNYSAGRQNTRALDSALTGGNVWFSFLAQNQTDNSRGGISFNQSDFGPGSPRVQTLGTDLYVNGSTVATGVFTVGQTALVLGRINVSDGGNDTWDIWVDPDVSGGPGGLGTPTATKVDNHITSAGITRLGNISYSSSGGAKVDMIYLSDGASGFADVTGVTPVPQPGGLIAQESFNSEPVGPFDGTADQNWTLGSSDEQIVADKSLSYSGGDVTIDDGGRVLRLGTQGGIVSPVVDFTFPWQTDTVYFSFLAEPSNEVFLEPFVTGTNNNDGSAAVAFNTRGTADTIEARLDVGTTLNSSSDLGDAIGDTQFVVGKLFKSTGDPADNYDRLQLILNPTTSTEPTSWDADLTQDIGVASVFRFGVRFGDAHNSPPEYAWIDEISIGTDYASVTGGAAPVPEPSTLVLGIIGLLGLGWWGRRRK